MRRLPPAACRAFSLLELILVLVVLGITTSVVAVRLSSMRQSEGVAQAGRTLSDQFNRGRSLALARGELTRLRLDLDAQTATVQVHSATGFANPADGDAPEAALRFGAETQTLSFSGADAKTQTTGQVDFLFYPDMRCEPSGRITLTKGASRAVVICPPAGRPACMEGTP